MAKRGENIYQKNDGRYKGRYVIGKRPNGRMRFGYICGYQYADVPYGLMEKKQDRLLRSDSIFERERTVAEWLPFWMENEVSGSV